MTASCMVDTRQADDSRFVQSLTFMHRMHGLQWPDALSTLSTHTHSTPPYPHPTRPDQTKNQTKPGARRYMPELSKLVPRLVHLSSAGVTRPGRPGIKVEEVGLSGKWWCWAQS